MHGGGVTAEVLVHTRFLLHFFDVAARALHSRRYMRVAAVVEALESRLCCTCHERLKERGVELVQELVNVLQQQTLAASSRKVWLHLCLRLLHVLSAELLLVAHTLRQVLLDLVVVVARAEVVDSEHLELLRGHVRAQVLLHVLHGGLVLLLRRVGREREAAGERRRRRLWRRRRERHATADTAARSVMSSASKCRNQL